MKKLRLSLLIGAILCCLLAFVGCGPATLSRPEGVRVDEETMELVWEDVENVRIYSIEINGDTRESRSNFYDLSGLEPGDYTFRVRALGEGDDYADSDWSESVSFVKERESGLIYTLN